MEEFELASKIHGHKSPGLALGVNMAKIAYEKLGTTKRGRGITGIAETKVCIPDALQAVAGTTPGNMSLIIQDYGKLALTIAIYDTKLGYRVSLKKEAAEASDIVEKFIYRKGKLTKEEREKLTDIFLNLDKKYFRVEKVKLVLPLTSERTSVLECSRCGELQPRGFMVENNGKPLCPICAGDKYFRPAH